MWLKSIYLYYTPRRELVKVLWPVGICSRVWRMAHVKRKIPNIFRNTSSFIADVHCPLRFCMPRSRRSNWELQIVDNMSL